MTTQQKLDILSCAIHNLQLHLQVTINKQKASEIIEAMCNWSYAHRQGECNEEERVEKIDKAYEALHRNIR